MAGFVKGDIVVVPFPFSDLSSFKRRPALILAVLDGDDVILCQITSRQKHDRYSISVGTPDMVNGSLNQPSMVRPNRVFTAESRIILRRVGRLNDAKLDEVVAGVVRILS